LSNTKPLFLLAAFLLSVLASNAAEQESTYLGVTEPSHAWSAGEKPRTPFVIRVAFQCKKGIWTILPNQAKESADLKLLARYYPTKITWNLGFDGKKIGTFQSHLPSEWFYYSDIGLQVPDSKATIPAINTGAHGFHFWGDPWAASPHNRPLVASSKNYLDDPDNWKPLLPPPPLSDRLVSAYRKALEKSAHDNNEVIFPPDQKKPQHGDEFVLALPDSAAEGTTRFRKVRVVVSKCYKSRKGDELVKLAVPSAEVKGAEDYVQWFRVKGNEVDSLGNDLELIDAGDYDHDGHSEIVFHKGGYDYDAYVLVYDNLRKQLEFGWSYH
jgi:hypothetical protein